MNCFEKVYRKIINFFGEQHQKELAIKLFKELICEIELSNEEGANTKRMIIVLANAQNMINQLKIMYEINSAEVIKEMNQKNEETLKTINEEMERNAHSWKGEDL